MAEVPKMTPLATFTFTFNSAYCFFLLLFLTLLHTFSEHVLPFAYTLSSPGAGIAQSV
jgi:hypothetical protein